MNAPTGTIKVWDPFVRVFHWTVAIGFLIAYLSEDVLLLHVWTGYVIGVMLVLRILWGLVGPRHARFTDFIYRPATVVAYMRDLIGFRSKRYIGHSPAGGAMVLALMAGLAATVWTGLELYAVEKNAGPLAAVEVHQPRTGIILVSDEDDGRGEEREGDGESVWEELHEAVANITLFLVFLHLAGVALASIAHRENLARSMVTGRKRPN